MMKNIGKMALVFLLTVCLLTGLLIASAFIPRAAIAPQMRASAEFLSQGEQFAPVIEGVNSTRIDRYADSILLGIVWQTDANDALRSVLEARYYHNPHQKETINLLDAVEQDLPANQQYLRYWHGSIVPVRLLMTLLTLPQIYLWHGILLAALAIALEIRLLRRKAYVPAVGFAVGLVGVGCWFIPLSLEFTWVFLILFVQLHLVLLPSFPKDWRKRGLFFLVSGMVTNYFDFLTCETLTLLLPLLFLLWLDREGNLPSIKTLLKTALAWAVGYGGMYLAKWALAGLVMGENPLPYVTSHVGERLVGSVADMNLFQEALGALSRNVQYIFPMDYGIIGGLIGLGLLIAAAYAGYVYHRKGFDKRRVLLYAALGMAPYVRFLALINHSYLHGFFTYRAQLATLFALALILGELTGWGEKQHG